MTSRRELIAALSEVTELYNQSDNEIKVSNAAILDAATRFASVSTDHNKHLMEECEAGCPVLTMTDIPNKQAPELAKLFVEILEALYESIVGLRAEVQDEKDLDGEAAKAMARLEEIKRRAHQSKRSNINRGNRGLLNAGTVATPEPITPPHSVRSDSPLAKPQVVEPVVSPTPAPKQIAKDATVVNKPSTSIDTKAASNAKSAQVKSPAVSKTSTTSKK